MNYTFGLSLSLVAILGMAGCSGRERNSATDLETAPDESLSASPVASKNIFRIYDEFVAAKTVARACGISTPELEEKHDNNFRPVSHAVRDDLVLKHGKPKTELDKFLQGHDEMIRTRTLEMLESHPCSGPDAKIVIERYKRQSQWHVET